MSTDAIVTRKIQFYRFDLGSVAGQQVQLDRAAIITAISNLSLEGRCLRTSDNSNSVIVEAVPPYNSYQLKFTRVIGVDLPRMYDINNFDSDEIPDGRGVGDSNHLIFFENNIIGLEINKKGSSIYKIMVFLKTILPHIFVESGRIEELAWPDLQQKFNRMHVITEVEISLRKSHLEHMSSIEQDDNILRAMRELQDIENNVGTATLIIKANDYKKRKANKMTGLGDSALRLIRSIGQSNSSNAVNSLVIRGVDPETERKESLNLLNHQLIVQKRVVKLDPRSRTTDSASVFEAILQAYLDNREAILHAPTIF